jgi:hypothetical protein
VSFSCGAEGAEGIWTHDPLDANEILAVLVADFHCREGWSRLGERRRGVWLRTLLALAGAADGAGHVTVGSGEYTAVLTREQAEDERMLLALEHEGAASLRRAGPAGQRTTNRSCPNRGPAPDAQHRCPQRGDLPR